MPTTTASASKLFEPLRTAAPAALNSAASSRPCRAIQMLCQTSITTASINTPALKSSCPAPSNSADKAPAK